MSTLKQAAQEFEKHLKIASVLSFRHSIQGAIEALLSEVASVLDSDIQASMIWAGRSGSPSANRTFSKTTMGIDLPASIELSARVSVDWVGSGAEVLVYAMTEDYDVKRKLELTLNTGLGLAAHSIARLVEDAFIELVKQERRRKR